MLSDMAPLHSTSEVELRLSNSDPLFLPLLLCGDRRDERPFRQVVTRMDHDRLAFFDPRQHGDLRAKVEPKVHRSALHPMLVVDDGHTWPAAGRR